MSNVVKIADFVHARFTRSMNEMNLLMNKCDKFIDDNLIGFASIVAERVDEKSSEVEHWKDLHLRLKKLA